MFCNVLSKRSIHLFQKYKYVVFKFIFKMGSYLPPSRAIHPVFAFPPPYTYMRAMIITVSNFFFTIPEFPHAVRILTYTLILSPSPRFLQQRKYSFNHCLVPYFFWLSTSLRSFHVITRVVSSFFKLQNMPAYNVLELVSMWVVKHYQQCCG